MSEHRNDMPKTPQKPQAPKEWLKGEILRAEVQRKAEEEAANLAKLKAEAETGKTSFGQRRGDKDAETRQRFVEDCAEAGQKGPAFSSMRFAAVSLFSFPSGTAGWSGKGSSGSEYGRSRRHPVWAL